MTDINHQLYTVLAPHLRKLQATLYYMQHNDIFTQSEAQSMIPIQMRHRRTKTNTTTMIGRATQKAQNHQAGLHSSVNLKLL